jgi:hypothetical protein
LSLEIRLSYFQVILLHPKSIDPVLDLCIADGTHKIYLFEGVSEAEGSGFGIEFVSGSWFECLMIASVGFFQFAEYFLKAALANTLFRFGTDAEGTGLRVLLQVSSFPELLNEISHAIMLIGELILPVQLVHPIQGFCGVSVGMGQQLQEDVE